MISPLAYVDPTAQIGEGVTIHPFAYIDGGTQIGAGSEIMPYASIIRGTTLGRNVRVYQGVIVGADPQDFRWKGEQTSCFVGDDVVIREHVIINRGIRTEGGTNIGPRCFIMANSHVGHDTEIVGKCVIGSNVTIAGGVKIDEGTILSSAAVVHERSRIGKFVLIKGGSRISGNVPPYVIMAHNPVGYYGINSHIMLKHAGFSEEQVEDVAKAYRHIYQSSTSVFNALQRVENDMEAGVVRDEILNFIRNCDLHILGHRIELDD